MQLGIDGLKKVEDISGQDLQHRVPSERTRKLDGAMAPPKRQGLAQELLPLAITTFIVIGLLQLLLHEVERIQPSELSGRMQM
eukprot:2039269-Amphidinium_carterae.3